MNDLYSKNGVRVETRGHLRKLSYGTFCWSLCLVAIPPCLLSSTAAVLSSGLRCVLCRSRTVSCLVRIACNGSASSRVVWCTHPWRNLEVEQGSISHAVRVVTEALRRKARRIYSLIPVSFRLPTDRKNGLKSRYDNLTVTIQHDTNGGGNFKTLAARGSPYMTFEFDGATPRIKSNGDILKARTRKGGARLRLALCRCIFGAGWGGREERKQGRIKSCFCFGRVSGSRAACRSCLRLVASLHSVSMVCGPC